MQAFRTTLPRFIVIHLLLHVTACHGRCDDPISFEHALKVIESCESKYKTVEWNVEYNWGYFDNLISPKSFKPRDANRPTSTHTIFEFHTGRYRFETAGISPWQGGSSSFAGERRIYTYDGENVCLYMQNCHEQRLPRSGDPQVAEIGPGKADNQCDAFHFWSMHPMGANFVFADCSARFVRYEFATVLPSFATRAGSEAVTPADLE